MLYVSCVIGGKCTSSNFGRCHFDGFVGVTEVYLSISFLAITRGRGGDVQQHSEFDWPIARILYFLNQR
jgi:hypothetical protein